MQLPAPPSGFLEIDGLDQVASLSERYKERFGRHPINVSSWNASPDFISRLPPFEFSISSSDAASYIFPYDLEEEGDLLHRLGFTDSCRTCLATPSGTASIFLLANWLRHAGVREVALIGPNYFTIEYALRNFGIVPNKLAMRRRGGSYVVPPIPDHSPSSKQAIWLTNPTYCTGTAFDDEGVATIGALLGKGHTIVADECLSNPENFLSRRFENYDNFVGYYAPHKLVAINALKFSAICAPRRYEKHFNDWFDITCGSLSSANYLAMRHFISDDYERYRAAFFSELSAPASFVRELLNEAVGLSVDERASGCYMTAYAPDIPHDYFEDEERLWRVMLNSGSTFISGVKNGFDESNGFCFRINLSSDSPQFRHALARLVNVLSSEVRTKTY